MTPIQLKVLIYETLQVQRDFTKFLMKAAKRYGHLLSEAEVQEGSTLMQRASETIDRLTEILGNCGSLTLSDAILQGKRSDEDLTAPPSGLCCVRGTPEKSGFGVAFRDMTR